MERLAVVEEARALFARSETWSVVRWLAEKRAVRELANKATAALAAANGQAKAQWGDELRGAYAELDADTSADDEFAGAEREFASRQQSTASEEVRRIARRVKEADEAARRATQKAEDTFALAERTLSVSLSRRGAAEAIESYDLRYEAIRLSEDAALLTRGNRRASASTEQITP